MDYGDPAALNNIREITNQFFSRIGEYAPNVLVIVNSGSASMERTLFAEMSQGDSFSLRQQADDWVNANKAAAISWRLNNARSEPPEESGEPS